jgi:hypothetical protein
MNEFQTVSKEQFRQIPRRFMLVAALLMFSACNSSGIAYKAYLGEVRDDIQLSVLQGGQMVRSDWINRYIDAVRFSQVDETPIQNSNDHEAIQIAPGFHEIRVYFAWDLGSQRGLAPALVNYISTQPNLSRTLRFNARAGEIYSVQAEPVFRDEVQDITTLSHVDFWVVDGNGNHVVSQEDGRYIPKG